MRSDLARRVAASRKAWRTRKMMIARKNHVEHQAEIEPRIPLDPELEFKVKQLIIMLDSEIGRRWVSFEIRLQLEEIEILLGKRGTNAEPG